MHARGQSPHYPRPKIRRDGDASDPSLRWTFSSPLWRAGDILTGHSNFLRSGTARFPRKWPQAVGLGLLRLERFVHHMQTFSREERAMDSGLLKFMAEAYLLLHAGSTKAGSVGESRAVASEKSSKKQPEPRNSATHGKQRSHGKAGTKKIGP
jgi:hypothetical protein